VGRDLFKRFAEEERRDFFLEIRKGVCPASRKSLQVVSGKGKRSLSGGQKELPKFPRAGKKIINCSPCQKWGGLPGRRKYPLPREGPSLPTGKYRLGVDIGDHFEKKGFIE